MKRMILLVACAVLLSSCANDKNSKNVTPTDDSTVNIVDSDAFVYGKSTYQIDFTTKPLQSPVEWESSDENIATVNKSLVTFSDVSEIKTVTVSAKSKNNPSSIDKIKFTVKPNVIDYQSTSSSIDFSELNKKGALFDTNNALMPFNLSAKDFYVEASFKIDVVNDGRIGFYLTNNSNGFKDENSNLIYINAKNSLKYSGYPYLYKSVGNEISEIVLPYKHIVNELDYYTVGISKVDDDLYIYGESDDCLKCYEHYFSTSLGDDNIRVGIFSEGVPAFVKSMGYIVGEEIKSMFKEPTRLYLQDTYKVINVGDSYDIHVKGDYLNFDKNKLSYVCSKEDVVTINEQGRVVGKKEGVVDVIVKYNNELDTLMTLVVLNETSNVIMDGEMNDPIYTDNVKKHSYKLAKDSSNYIDFYASRTVEGAYIFADYYVTDLKNSGSNWWDVDNFECYFGNENQIQVISQYYVSLSSNNFEKSFITEPVFDSEKNLYNIHFEVFVSFRRLNSPYDGLLTFGPGFNSKAGWAQSSARANQDIYSAIAITKDGFAHYNGSEWIYDEPTPPEEEYEDLLSTVVVKNCINNLTGTDSCNPNNWTKMVHSDKSTHFSYTMAFNQNGGVAYDTANDSYLSHIRLYIYDATTAYNDDEYSVSNNKVTAAFIQSRSDWWIDSYDATGSSSSTNSIYTTKSVGSNYITAVSSDWKPYMKNYFADVDTTIKIERNGGTLTITYTFIGKKDGYLQSFSLTQSLTGLKTSNLGIALCGRKVSFALSEFYKGTKQ